MAECSPVGIGTGPVVVGDLIGTGSTAEEAVVGETPNLAARLQGLAEPGAVVIAEGTRRLLGDLFALAELGPRALKGFGMEPPEGEDERRSPVNSSNGHEADLTLPVGRVAITKSRDLGVRNNRAAIPSIETLGHVLRTLELRG